MLRSAGGCTQTAPPAGLPAPAAGFAQWQDIPPGAPAPRPAAANSRSRPPKGCGYRARYRPWYISARAPPAASRCEAAGPIPAGRSQPGKAAAPPCLACAPSKAGCFLPESPPAHRPSPAAAHGRHAAAAWPPPKRPETKAAQTALVLLSARPDLRAA